MKNENSKHPALLDKKIAIITGAGTGIGKAVAKVFVRENATVIVSDITGQEDEVARELGANAEAINCDLRDEAQIESMFQRAVSRHGRVDIVVNAAGIPGSRRTPLVSPQEYEEITDVHLRGTLLVNKHAIKVMSDAGKGAIVNFSAVASLNGDGRISAAYAAAKAGVNSMTKSFALHYAMQGIRVNAIAPGFTLSEKNSAISPEVKSAMSAKAALNRAANADEQAEVAAFLASDRASFVTGVVLPVDGGWSAKLA